MSNRKESDKRWIRMMPIREEKFPVKAGSYLIVWRDGRDRRGKFAKSKARQYHSNEYLNWFDGWDMEPVIVKLAEDWADKNAIPGAVWDRAEKMHEKTIGAFPGEPSTDSRRKLHPYMRQVKEDYPGCITFCIFTSERREERLVLSTGVLPFIRWLMQRMRAKLDNAAALNEDIFTQIRKNYESVIYPSGTNADKRAVQNGWWDEELNIWREFQPASNSRTYTELVSRLQAYFAVAIMMICLENNWKKLTAKWMHERHIANAWGIIRKSLGRTLSELAGSRPNINSKEKQ